MLKIHFLACRSCESFTNKTVPGGDQPTNGFYIIDMARDANDCDVAVFKCVVFDPRCVATSYVVDASGYRLMTYPASNTTSQGGNMTCTVLRTGADWRYNGVEASFRCNYDCTSEGGTGADDVTFVDETTVEPTEPVTTECARCNDIESVLLPPAEFILKVELVVNTFIAADGCKMTSFKCVVLEKGHTATAYISDSTTELGKP
ncbi:unnamed protein product [Caenorhabditis nigoni]